MSELNELELKELMLLDNKMIVIAYAVVAYKDCPKQLKHFYSLAKTERKNVENAKSPVSETNVQTVIWRYDELIDHIGILRKTSDPVKYSKASADLDRLIDAVEKEIDMCNGKLSVSDAVGSVKKFVGRVTDGTRKVIDSIIDSVGQTKKITEPDTK